MQQRNLCVTLLAEPSADKAEGKVTGFAGVAYSGGIVPNHGWSGDMAIDLASLTVPPGEVTILRNHDPNQIVGRAKVANDGKQLTLVSGSFSQVTPQGQEVADLMAEGHPWMLSVGINGRRESCDKNKRTKLNGSYMKIDSVFRNSRLLEVSFVPSGADPNAYAARLSARHGIQPPSGDDMNELEQAQARIAELEAQVATLTTERDAVRAELSTVNAAQAQAAAARRTEQITALFGADAELTDDERAAYLAMTDAQFSAMQNALTKARQTADPALFRQQATNGRNEGNPTSVTLQAPAGYSVDPERAQLHARALQHQAAHPGTDYLAAVNAVSQGA